MSARLDHAVVFVKDVVEAQREYTDKGFTVLAGGVHAGGRTHNVIIPFGDGTYVELLGFTWPAAYEELREAQRSGSLAAMLQNGTALDRRFLPRGSNGPGLADFAVSVDDIDQVMSRAQKESLGVDGPFPGSREKSDGTTISWNLVFPQHEMLPFLIDDVTDRSERVPTVGNDFHANGVGAITGVRYRVNDRDLAQFTKLASVLGAQVRSDGASTRIELSGGSIHLTVGDESDARPDDLLFSPPVIGFRLL